MVDWGGAESMRKEQVNKNNATGSKKLGMEPNGQGHCPMTAKEYLQQLRRLDTVISQKKLQRSELRSLLESIAYSASNTGGPLQGAGSGFGRIRKIIELVSIEEEIDQLMDEYIYKKHKIICKIHNLGNANQIRVLYERYVAFEKFEQIAVNMNFSIRNIYTIHGQALREFQKRCMQG